jgi:2-haloacid dehalogenase
MIKAVVFDIGGVLLDWDPRHLYRQLIDDEAELSRFLDQICTRQWHLAHDLGADTEQSCRELAGRHPEHADLIMAWSDRSEEMVAGVFEDTVEILRELSAAGVPCFVLSNMEPDKFASRRARYDFFGLVDGCVISGLEGVAKPDPAIFEVLLSRYRLEPEATVFIDDLPANVAAASELGVVGLTFTTTTQLRQDLRALGLAVAAPG